MDESLLGKDKIWNRIKKYFYIVIFLFLMVAVMIKHKIKVKARKNKLQNAGETFVGSWF